MSKKNKHVASVVTLPKIIEAPHHCDGYYFTCHNRTDYMDRGDIRKDKDGWLKEMRYLCKTDGKVLDEDGCWKLCRHCPENRGILAKQTRTVRKNRRLASSTAPKAPRVITREEGILCKILGITL
jgi:hypothetical protein